MSGKRSKVSIEIDVNNLSLVYNVERLVRGLCILLGDVIAECTANRLRQDENRVSSILSGNLVAHIHLVSENEVRV